MMKNIDYIIVGDGYAGIFFAHQLIKSGKSFKLFSEGKKAASHISAGVCNPVILKRYNKIWNDEAQMQFLPKVFSEIEVYLGKNYLVDERVVRVFHDEGEQQLWLKKAGQEKFSDYLDPELIKLDKVRNPFEAGAVINSCRLEVKAFFNDFFKYLDENDFLVNEKFDYQDLNVEEKSYHDLSFQNIVFAEGCGLKQNPFFSDIPVRPNKGHRLSVHLEDDSDAYVVKKKHFLFKFSDGEYYYGGTYDRDSTTDDVEEKAVDELTNALTDLYPKSFTINEVSTAFRATVADRRSIIGRHKMHSNVFILNGLGARGVLNGSCFADMLFQHINDGKEILEEVDVKRFYQSDNLS